VSWLDVLRTRFNRAPRKIEMFPCLSGLLLFEAIAPTMIVYWRMEQKERVQGGLVIVLPAEASLAVAIRGLPTSTANQFTFRPPGLPARFRLILTGLSKQAD
jgi:hypothetical protein